MPVVARHHEWCLCRLADVPDFQLTHKVMVAGAPLDAIVAVTGTTEGEVSVRVLMMSDGQRVGFASDTA